MLYIGPFGAIVINGRTKIRKNCNIAHSTTIGQANRGKHKGYRKPCIDYCKTFCNGLQYYLYISLKKLLLNNNIYWTLVY